MKQRSGTAIILLAAIMALSGCGRNAEDTASPAERATPAQSAASAPLPEPTADGGATLSPSATPGQGYIEAVVQETISKFAEPGMNEYEKARAAFDYMIETTAVAEPVGLDLWRIRGESDALPSFVENRSLSVMLYGIGMCEDYAAALTMLLRGMGMEAEYVPGLTYAANGSGLVDHAWTVAKIDGVWYHLDCQLEDNISRRDTTRYKYFMRSDATMAGSHRWGQQLMDAKLLTAAQNEEIAQGFLYEACPQDYPTPSPRTFTSAQTSDIHTIQAEIDAEFREYESMHEALPPLELNTIPPVFGLDGFGPPD